VLTGLQLISQHALAPVVEVYEGAKSVLLPCEYSGFIPENPTVLWTRNDLNPKSVHLRREETDDLKGQNQHYSGRTSMRPDALDTSDFSLTLRNPEATDSSIYTCSIGNERGERKLADIQLHVKGTKPNTCYYKGQRTVSILGHSSPDYSGSPGSSCGFWRSHILFPSVFHVSRCPLVAP
uniref:Ig-like domain-containing protein n=1 Tax=Maylandia zebra TaxID=106582 RepID=A0A3P9DT23_9CICH